MKFTIRKIFLCNENYGNNLEIYLSIYHSANSPYWKKWAEITPMLAIDFPTDWMQPARYVGGGLSSGAEWATLISSLPVHFPRIRISLVIFPAVAPAFANFGHTPLRSFHARFQNPFLCCNFPWLFTKFFFRIELFPDLDAISNLSSFRLNWLGILIPKFFGLRCPWLIFLFSNLLSAGIRKMKTVSEVRRKIFLGL